MLLDKEQFIVGTAGHIDHGKTALVKALTGVDADTLPDEKRRGITIELGFVFMDDPLADKQIMFIDCPGHEKLVRTMVAGASNIDAILLVIASDEGINLQTIEHFEIIKLLGISNGLVALTKTDLIDAERLAKVTSEVRAFLQDSLLQDCDIIPVSSKTKAGTDLLKDKLRLLSNHKIPRRDNGVFRMPIDRVFTIKGFGTIVAGTSLSGTVKVDDQLELFPDQKIVSVRGVQVKNTKSQISTIGLRTALNLRDIKKEELHRGQCLAEPNSLIVSNRIDVELHLLSSYAKPLKNGTKVRLHVGTAEIMARAIILDSMIIEPGENGLVQLILDTPTAVLPRDRFIIRSFSPVEVIGGGLILDANSRKHKRSDQSVTAALKDSKSDLSQAIELIIQKEGFQPIDKAGLLRQSGEDSSTLDAILAQLLEDKLIVETLTGFLHAHVISEGIELIRQSLVNYLDDNHFKHFMPLSQLRSALSKILTKKQFAYLVELAREMNLLQKKANKITLKDYSKIWQADEFNALELIIKAYSDGGYAPPLEAEICQNLNLSPKLFNNLLSYLLDAEKLVRLDSKVVYYFETLAEIKAIVIDYINTNKSISVADLRDVLAVSRKYTLAILEYYDTIGLTKRIDNNRVLK